MPRTFFFAQLDSRAPGWYDLIWMPEVIESKGREEARGNRAKVWNIEKPCSLRRQIIIKIERNYEISQKTNTWLYCRAFSVQHALPHFHHRLQTNPLRSKLPAPQLLALLLRLLENHRTSDPWQYRSPRAKRALSSGRIAELVLRNHWVSVALA